MTGKRDNIHSLGKAFTQRIMDDGRIVESGWQVLNSYLPENAPDMQRQEMRKAFFLGAHHVFGAMMMGLDEGEEATDKDLDRMSALADELSEFMRSLNG